MNMTDGALPSVPTNHTDPTMAADSYIFTAAYITNFVVGLPTNSYVVWLIATGAGSGLTSEFFALNLSVSEIIYSLGNPVSLFRTYIFQAPVIYSMGFFTGLIVTGRPLFQCCICLERYLAVVHPVAFLKYRPLRYRVACSAVAWLMVLGSCVFDMFKFNTNLFQNVLLFQCLVFFFVKLFCCLAVLRALKQPGPGEGGRERQGENQMKKRAFRIILIIQMTMVVNYCPLLVITMLNTSLIQAQLLLARPIYFYVMIMAGLVQPFLYLHRAGKLPCIRAP